MKLLGAELVPGGVEKYWLHNGDDNRDRITVETVVDVEPILKRNAEEFNSASARFNGEMCKVANVPGVVLIELAKKSGISFSELMNGKTEKARHVLNQLLNGREFTAFRTRPGRVDVSRGIR